MFPIRLFLPKFWNSSLIMLFRSRWSIFSWECLTTGEKVSTVTIFLAPPKIPNAQRSLCSQVILCTAPVLTLFVYVFQSPPCNPLWTVSMGVILNLSLRPVQACTEVYLEYMWRPFKSGLDHGPLCSSQKHGSKQEAVSLFKGLFFKWQNGKWILLQVLAWSNP